MRLATLMRPVRRARPIPSEGGGEGAPMYVLWEHDGENVSGFILSVDGTEHDVGALTPIGGTTYRTDITALGYGTGAHDIVVIAYNGDVRADAAEVTLTW